jgi:hypothetical protein
MVTVRDEQPVMFLCAKQMNYERARACALTRHSQVSCYANSTTIASKICNILVACAADILTVSENSNMGFLRDGAATEAPATAVKRTLVDGYAAWIRFVQSVTSNLATYYEAAKLVALPYLRRTFYKAHSSAGRGCEGCSMKHNVMSTARLAKYSGRCVLIWSRNSPESGLQSSLQVDTLDKYPCINFP